MDTYPPALSRPAVRMGNAAPEFHARSTKGNIALSDYRGKWLIFFSHPADFTPVCTTEFIALAKAAPAFEARQCALLGLSVDSLYAHHAWLRAIQTEFGVAITFPVIEDPSMAIGRAYGMIDEAAEDSTAVRATYFIDPDGIVRATTTYPHTVGRSVTEMLRTLAALQRVDEGNAVTPEGWQPGDPVLAPLPDTIDDDDPKWFCRPAASP